eukprot:GABW01001513.1.p1 GENE.GABW01001513.1~~GABW01001513.1.p1  ORF type:complete len:99 (-),score=27.72 GABW01001513.1:3-299(-)
MRNVAVDVQPQDVVTSDDVPVRVNAVVFFEVSEPVKAVTRVNNYTHSTRLLAQSYLRTYIGECRLRDLISHQERLNAAIRTALDKKTDPWGIKVTHST